jgi:uncharacterized protein (DUF2141 family)
MRILSVFRLLNLLCLFFLLVSFSTTSKSTLKITINKLRNNKGNVIICLFKGGVGYPDNPKKAYRRSVSKITNKVVVFEYQDLPSDDYAIAMLHDENEDNEMTTNAIGLPKEGYGFSNNVMGAFGPPEYSKSSFNYIADNEKELIIRTRY